VDEQFADVNVVNRVPNGGGGVMVWAGISYGQRTQLQVLKERAIGKLTAGPPELLLENLMLIYFP
jgi:hypothetical protein